MAGSGVRPDVSDRLSIRSFTVGTILCRTHRADLNAIWFGPDRGNPPRYRFDAPDRSYQVCYLGLTERAAFVEGVVHRAIPRRIISEKTLAARAISEIRVVEKIRAARLYGRFLIPTGATNAVTHGELYETVSQPWSKAIYEHPDTVDGILYSAKHDETQIALVLFDRAAHKIEAGAKHPLSGTDLRTLRLLEFYKLALAA
jgi:hypothetical protein